ncbi:MAG: YjjG family noncanonical pyrimidine nucleotidase [Oscillospiraceae bacterium]|nr:YjjG family noncanonical pyrimidine nucleotidase [Oscillospiraceae bacterium]
MTAVQKTKPIVLLDLDNTILDFDMAERTALGRAFTEMGVRYDDALLKRYNQINIRHWEMLEDGVLTRDQVLVKRFEALYRETGMEADAYRTQLLYESLLAEGHWFMPGAEELLETLQGRCRMFLCSNGTASVQEGRIRSAGIGPYFENIFVSEHMGANKPEKRYFDLCFAEIPDFDRERCVMLGDSLTSDIRGGINAGVKTCWFNPKGKPNPGLIRPDWEIHALDEFPPLLDKMF